MTAASPRQSSWSVVHGDCIPVMHSLTADSIDAIVCDPPYGMEFMGKDWDGANGFRRSLNDADVDRPNVFGRSSRTGPEYRAGLVFQEWCETWATEALRVLRPGGYLLAFGGTRTYHRLVSGLEDAGFEVRDQIAWLYGSGFPKHPSCLKPAQEPIVLARKAARYSKPLQIDAARIDGPGWTKQDGDSGAGFKTGKFMGDAGRGEPTQAGGLRESQDGRWPANVALDEEAAAALDEQSGTLSSGAHSVEHQRSVPQLGHGGVYGEHAPPTAFTQDREADSGGASRFFYVAKPDGAERHVGLAGRNPHPTVKPVTLMRWLCRLVTPPGGTVLDPFTGSGTTGIAAMREGFSFIGIEQDAAYVDVARARIIGDAPLINGAMEVQRAA